MIILVAGLYVYNDIKNISDSDTEVSSFSECAKLQTSTIKPDNPNATCTTKGGQIFKEIPTSYTKISSDSSQLFPTN